jgi:hypothetical protein
MGAFHGLGILGKVRRMRVPSPRIVRSGGFVRLYREFGRLPRLSPGLGQPASSMGGEHGRVISPPMKHDARWQFRQAGHHASVTGET